MLIHKTLAEIRELRNEELDLVGGSTSAEPSQSLTSCKITIYPNESTSMDITITDDVMQDVTPD